MRINNFADIRELLFDNKTVRQTIFKNTFWLGAGMAVSKVLKLILIIYVARILGATEYGKFTFALAFISLFIVFSSLGLPDIIIREFSRRKERRKEFYSVLSLQILLSLGTFILILTSSLFVTSDPNIRKIIWILAIFSLIEGFSTVIYVFFQARQRMEYQALGVIFQALIVTAVGFFVILNFPSVENLSYGYLFSSLVALIFILIFTHIKVLPLRIFWQKSVWKKFLAMSWPLALAGLFGTIYIYIDSVMMGYWGMITETGWYNAAYRIAIVSLIPMALISGSFYPVLSKFFRESKEKLQKAWSYQVETMILFAVPLIVGGMILAPRIIDFLYGQAFSPSILAFQILIIMTGIIFIYRPFSDLLIASNQQRKIFWITLTGALINIILNLILIPKFSLYGAAVATVITYLLVLFLSFTFTLKFTPVQPLNLKFLFSFIIASLSSIVMYFVISQPKIYNLNILFSISIGALIYLVSLFVFKKVTKPIYEKI